MTTNHELDVGDLEVVRTLRELNNAATAARAYVLAESTLENLGAGHIIGNPATRVLDALDAAIADAGDFLARVGS